jgi:hypothetical protein
MKTTRKLIFGALVLGSVVGLALSEDKPASQSHPKRTVSPKAQTPGPAVNAKAGTNFPVIGYLEGRSRIITIKAGLKGPIYSVKTVDGKILCENLSQEQLSARLPEAGEFLKTAVAGSGSKGGVYIDASLRREASP